MTDHHARTIEGGTQRGTQRGTRGAALSILVAAAVVLAIPSCAAESQPETGTMSAESQLDPEAIRPFTTKGVYDLDEQKHLSFTQGAGHGGSHPHLAHEFITALIEDRDPYPNAVQSANWTCVGICAHQSATGGGKIVELPAFTR